MKRAAILALVWMGACGTDRASVPTLDTSGSRDASTPERDGSAPPSAIDAGSLDALAPRITFTAPLPSSDPNADTVLSDANLVARCKVEQSDAKGSVGINTSTIELALLKEDAMAVQSMPAVNALPDEEYEASFDLSAQPNGPIHLRCRGKDKAEKPRTGTGLLSALLDLGPTIEFFEPKDMGIYTLKTPVAIQFQVKRAPLADGDMEADVGEVRLSIGGVDTPVQESDTAPGLYQTNIDFEDRTKFPVPPTSAQISVSASNGRTPDPATRVKTIDIGIDGDGPDIKVVAPKNGEIVHGEVTLRVNVTDLSGLMPGTLVANINNGLIVVEEWDGAGPEYSHKFDTRDIKIPLTQLTINVTAADRVGNEATVSHQLKLDNVPPRISLDPPLIREFKIVNGTVYCSRTFDPVGDGAANEKQKVVDNNRFRALVEDDTNRAPNAVAYLAGVDRDSVAVFAQPDNSIPLVIDTNDDGRCDDINSEALKTGKPVKISLAAVSPTGGAFYDKTELFPDGGACKADPGGKLPGDSIAAICPFTEMWRVMPGRIQGGVPAVYGYRPTNDGKGECTGETWQLQGIAKEGWLCVAASVKDTIGNIGVSAPLRLCFDDNNPGNGVPDCDPNKTLPNCTDGCVMTADQKFNENELWPQNP
jgi:hypothetical protein